LNHHTYERKLLITKNIQVLATDFITIPTRPPAKGLMNPTSGALIKRHKSGVLRSNSIQHNVHGTAARPIRIYHGVRKTGGKVCSSTAKGARMEAPAILAARLLELNKRIAYFHNKYQSYASMSIYKEKSSSRSVRHYFSPYFR
jgi:hypothetical protein